MNRAALSCLLVLLGFLSGLAAAQLLNRQSLQPLLWPLVVLASVALLAQVLWRIARSGIRVEIFTRAPIEVGTRGGSIKAEVTKVRL
ncbi:hypothetical protein [Synechococcus sp. NB0720_010]|uniref:hypothetical protein n=1 Tax=Synechococcus sp. NB0720_010 TaxID=2907159 RepID=UPI001FF98C18|nr:hypothetical protein [Synechococcus sp. NB0720_010]UPH90181.1 hypothetical protein LY254_00210 [Synechococcus sp. NB0720_010]